jgi:regulator of protease activity HflC (stomatin/prohibitin superfamily)
MASKDDVNLTKLIMKIVGGVVVLILGIVFIANSVTTVAADEIVVKQNFFDGKLQVWSSPGVHWQNFGRLTTYKRSAQYSFDITPADPNVKDSKPVDETIQVRFNDGGHGNVGGSLRFDLPTDELKMLKLHSTYHSMEAINRDLIRPVVNKSVFMTGPLMSSRESYAEKRADLISHISDQILHGVYRTERHTSKQVDIISGVEKNVDMVVPKVGPTGVEREEVSPIETFGINAYNISIQRINYDPAIEKQIEQQQQATMAVQQAMVDARKAEQAAITTAKQGEAEAAKAKWAQEVIKATEITKAQQDKDVATLQATKNKEVAALNLETSKLDAQTTMTNAKADSDARKLAITADNALEKRLEAYVTVQKAWAAAYGAQRQTPDIQMGGGGGGGTSQSLVDMMTVKTARDLNVSTK